MILLSVSDSLQVANSTTDWMQENIVPIVFGSIGVGLTIYTLCKANNEKREAKRLEKEKYRIEITPSFKLIHYSSNNQSKSTEYIVKNNNGTAKNIDCILLEGEYLKVEVKIKPDNTIIMGDEFHLKFETTLTDKWISECSGRFLLTYEDIENNKYSRVIEVNGEKVVFQ